MPLSFRNISIAKAVVSKGLKQSFARICAAFANVR